MIPMLKKLRQNHGGKANDVIKYFTFGDGRDASDDLDDLDASDDKKILKYHTTIVRKGLKAATEIILKSLN